MPKEGTVKIWLYKKFPPCSAAAMRLATVPCIPTLLALFHIQNTLQTPSTCLEFLKVKLQRSKLSTREM